MALDDLTDHIRTLCAPLMAGDLAVAQVNHRRVKGSERVVFRVSGTEGALAVKCTLSPRDPQAFDALVAAHRDAVARLGETAHAPAALRAVDSAEQIMVLDWIDGAPFGQEALLAVGKKGKTAKLLTQAGAWIAAFQDPAKGEVGVFRPKFSLDHLATIWEQTRDGSRRIPEAPAFRAALTRLEELGPSYMAEATRGHRHGDLHTGNLLIRATGATGIDFDRVGMVPIGHDIARFLVDFTVRYGSLDKLTPGIPLPEATLDAFFEGYGAGYRNDPSVQFLLRYHILADWLNIPADAKRRSWRHDHRLDQLLRLVENCFGVSVGKAD